MPAMIGKALNAWMLGNEVCRFLQITQEGLRQLVAMKQIGVLRPPGARPRYRRQDVEKLFEGWFQPAEESAELEPESALERELEEQENAVVGE